MESIKELFGKADKEGIGKVSLNQMWEVIKEDNDLTDDDVEEGKKEMADAWGLNGDEMLTFDEYQKRMNKSIEDAVFGSEFNITKANYFFEEVVMVLIVAADKDKTGYLTASQLKEVLVKMKPKDNSKVGKTVDMFMKMGDTDGDKKLKWEEALKLLTGKEEKEDAKEKMKTLFRMCDTNDDGYISKMERAQFIKMVNTYDYEEDELTEAEKEQQTEFKTMYCFMSDMDGDGKLNYLEFCAAMTSC